MKVQLKSAIESDIELLWKMQIEAFSDLLEKYRDFDTNPGNEGIDKIAARFCMPGTVYYFIWANETLVGAVRIVDHKDGIRKKRIAPIFILKEYRNKGYAQAAIREAEIIHGDSGWMLDTILQEEGNCHLYEKMGYKKTGETRVVNEKLTLVYYEK